jgi:hypothetical protein
MLRGIAGPHVQSFTSDAFNLVTARRLGCLKILNTAVNLEAVRRFHANNPTAPVCCRLVEGDDINTVAARTDKALSLFMPLADIVGSELLYIEVPINEAYQAGDDLKRLDAVTAREAAKIRTVGARPVGLNFGVGNPARIAGAVVSGELITADTSELRFIQESVSVLVEAQGAVGYHNYTVPTSLLDQWLDLRYRRMQAELPAGTRWWLNEGFIDRGIIDGRLSGWRDDLFHLSAEDAARLMRRMAQEYTRDLNVVGWTPFGCGAYQEWESFEYANEPVICQVLTEGYEVEGSTERRVGTGLRKMIPYIGQPLEDEVYHFPGTPLEFSAAKFENGKATWSRDTNTTLAERTSDGAVFTDRGNRGDGVTVWQLQ